MLLSTEHNLKQRRPSEISRLWMPVPSDSFTTGRIGICSDSFGHPSVVSIKTLWRSWEGMLGSFGMQHEADLLECAEGRLDRSSKRSVHSSSRQGSNQSSDLPCTRARARHVIGVAMSQLESSRARCNNSPERDSLSASLCPNWNLTDRRKIFRNADSSLPASTEGWCSKPGRQGGPATRRLRLTSALLEFIATC